jgi:glycosyltransferase involved in cell wall biosynthesis
MKTSRYIKTFLRNVYKSIIPRMTPVHRAILIPWLTKRIKSQTSWITEKKSAVYGQDELVVICVVRNGEGYIRNFIDHHIKLGASHIVFLDNGSTDRTVEIARGYCERVSVLSCSLPYGQYQTAYKHWLAKTFGHGCWCLVADIDERFDFPYSDRITLKDFLRYLNQHHYSGVVTQMVDLFSEGPIETWPELQNIESEAIWYDHSDRTSYTFDPISKLFDGNRYASSDITILTSGIRKAVFDFTRPLTKQMLFFPDRGAYPITSHWVMHARFADVSCALLHYPFDRGFRKRCEEIVRRKSHWKQSGEYRIYLSKLIEAGGDFILKKPTAKRFENINQLIADGHIVVSDVYLQYVDELQ